LVGIYGGTIKNSYALGVVSGTGSYYGSLVGSSGGTTTSNYYNSQTIPQNNNGAGIPKSPAEMQTQSTYADWDFGEIWEIEPNTNGGMPYLLWQSLMSRTEIAFITEQEYNGSQIKPEPTVSLNGNPLTKDEDFYYDYGANLNAGTGSVTAVGITATYFGKKTATFSITKNTTLTPPFPTITPRTAEFSTGLTLAEIAPPLPSNCEWANPETQITKAGEQEFNVECSNSNYEKKATGLVSVNVAKGDGTGTVSIAASWGYGEEAQTPSVNSTTHDTPVFYYTGRNNTNYSKSTTQPTDAGDYTVTATFSENECYKAFTTSADFTINKAQGTGSVSMESWYAGETAPQPVPKSPTNGTDAVTYRYWSADGTTYSPSSSVPSNPGSYIVEAAFLEKLNYSSFKAYYAFDIFQKINVNV